MARSESMRPWAQRVDLAGWIWRAVIAIGFAYIGATKFNGAPGTMWVKIYAQIGLGQWFRIFTGVIEVGGAVLYLFPRTCKVGAALLASAMLGAIVAHLTVLHDPISVIIPGALLVAVVLVALREPELDLLATRYRRDPTHGTKGTI